MNSRQERSWMYNRRKNGKFSLRFMRGLEEFLDFARTQSMSSEIRCPCKKCKNCCGYAFQMAQDVEKQA